MKTYISTGIGDMVMLDSLLTLQEKALITEIYWACRFGKCLVPLFENNPDYPNLRQHHNIDDDVGKQVMSIFEPHSVEYWHFRPDYQRNFFAGLKLFGIENEYIYNQLYVIDSWKLFYHTDRKYVGSSFLKNAKPTQYGDHILFHYPTSSRLKEDIPKITTEDWQFVDNLSKETNLKVIVVSDSAIEVPLSNYELLVNPDIRLIVDLAASCSHFAGCDSFCSHLAARRLPKERLFIKSVRQNIKEILFTTTYARNYLPHSPEDVALFYKSYIGKS